MSGPTAPSIVAFDPGDDITAGLAPLLKDHASSAGHPFDGPRFAFHLRDGEHLVGGASGVVIFDWGHLRYLAVADAWRGQGHGERLLARAEAFARDAGARGMFVDTYGFQAPGFYARAGYAEMARLTSADPACTRFYFTKIFEVAGP